MNKYYLHNGSENIGPFDIEELKQHNVTPTTQVWCEGMEDWKNAGTIEELKKLFPLQPPPLRNEKNKVDKNIKSTSKNRTFKVLAIIILSIIFLLIIINVIARQTPSPTYHESVMTIEEIEAQSPLNYLNASGKYNENFFGDAIKIDGTVSNNASMTTYKDITIRVYYYSKTKALITSEDYILYEFYPPNTTSNFKLKVKNYSNVNTVGWEVVNASIK